MFFRCLFALSISLLLTVPSQADLTVTMDGDRLLAGVPDRILLPNTAGQEVIFRVAGPDFFSAFNFRGVIAKGIGPAPVFNGTVGTTDGTDYQANASVWATSGDVNIEVNAGGAPLDNPPQPLFGSTGNLFFNAGDEVQGPGVIVTALVDTSGITSGTYSFDLAGANVQVRDQNNNLVAWPDSTIANAAGQIVATTFLPGTISVPEPSAFAYGFIAIGAIFLGRVGWIFKKRS